MENSELYSDSGFDWASFDYDTSGESDIQTMADPEEETSDSSREEEVQESEPESETESAVVVNDSDTLNHIDNTLNSFLGLFVATLVVLGIGLIIRFIWKLLNK